MLYKSYLSFIQYGFGHSLPFLIDICKGFEFISSNAFLLLVDIGKLSVEASFMNVLTTHSERKRTLFYFILPLNRNGTVHAVILGKWSVPISDKTQFDA